MNKLSAITQRAVGIIKANGYSTGAQGSKQITSLQVEIDLDTLPFIKDKRLNPLGKALESMNGVSALTTHLNISSSMRGYFGADNGFDPIPDNDPLSFLILKMRNEKEGGHVFCCNPSEVVDGDKRKDLLFQIVVKKLSDSQRIKYSSEDKEYLNTLWEQVHYKSDKEARVKLDEILKDIPLHGFVLKFTADDVQAETELPELYSIFSFISYVISELTDILPLSVIGDFSALKTTEEFNVCKDKEEHYISFNPAFKGLVNLCKGGDIAVSEFLNMLEEEHFIINYESIEH